MAVAVAACAGEGAELADTRISGIAAEEAAAQRGLEARLVDAIEPALLREISRTLTTDPHIAGGAGQERVRDYVADRFREWGLETQIAEYEVYLPWPTEASLFLRTPARGGDGWSETGFTLAEAVLHEAPVTGREQFPWVNGFSGAGSVEEEVVYVNYGLHEDYAELEEAGISVDGRIVLARYGRSFRGIKAQLAEENGAVGIVMFSDPADDGYVMGEMYPDGPYRPGSGVQRGSVMNGAGDPTTPGRPSLPGVERLDPGDEAAGLPTIPVMPVSFEVARQILDGVRGHPIPDQSWQGGLPLRYRVGPGPARLRMTVRHDGAYRPIHNVVARIEGTEWPDEWVVVGGHIDAWGAGANDNVSGTASVMATAQAFARLLADGVRPKRTVIFAGWDAEEWGLIGSTEWVEEHREALERGGVAYLNQDAIAGGASFGGSGSPSLKSFLVEATRAVSHPDGGTVEDAWLEQQDVSVGSDLSLGNLGGGSDFAGFYNHVGVPSTGHGFGGPSGVYHSAYDTYHWMTKFGDPDFQRHATSARIAAVMALRLANAMVLPYDYGRFGRELGDVAWELARAGERTERERAAIREVRDAFERLGAAGETLEGARGRALSRGVDAGQAAAANGHLRQVERAMTRDEGLARRPWYRNLVFAADYRNGYATIALPSIQEAIRDGNEERIVDEALDLAERVDAAVGHVLAASQALR
ncbi:MAG: M20/M25/M40 family metallo-hydrolase [Gemmatimonadota bacterium]